MRLFRNEQADMKWMSSHLRIFLRDSFGFSMLFWASILMSDTNYFNERILSEEVFEGFSKPSMRFHMDRIERQGIIAPLGKYVRAFPMPWREYSMNKGCVAPGQP